MRNLISSLRIFDLEHAFELNIAAAEIVNRVVFFN